ncbi:Ger(x)C family spore germination protein [Sporosarcina sp. Marseille-Q4063]|uniref:Ger(x)C family spore germination protein n=1 Tax=Sporosarcina sp. Marseille-Q4063 TaxID=2810514 RepID=UPI001BAE9EC4|nr:Ger(x)C family spore germination protein [Sporosarcina sp. Marseille-Q4063]QUW23124.1 Ger(x)C family spore germination protein [Sporosarcina sp. Marseille-Q4063]
MKKYKLLFFIIGIALTAGCTETGQRTSVEELSLVSSIGFDIVDAKEMRMTVGIPQPAGESPILTEAYSINTEMVQEGLVELSSTADKMIVLNQLRTLLFSEEFAKSGKMTEIVEHFYRDSAVGNKVSVVIVKDKVEDVLKADYPENQHMDAYLNELFEPKLHTSFSPFTTIHDYINTQTSPVYHTMVPYLEKKGESLEVTKIALFSSEEMVDTISTEESLLIQALVGLKKLSPLAIKFKDNETDDQLFLEQIENDAKIKGNRNIESPKVNIHLKIRAVLVEYKGERDLSKVGEYKKLEKEIDKHLEKQIEDLLKKLQKMELDPVGISEHFRMYHKGKWTIELTKKVIGSLDYTVNVDMKVVNTGTLR